MAGKPRIFDEDEPLILMDLIDTLNEVGFKTFEASCAKEAVEIMGRRPEDISLLITDINLGAGPSE
ncbi:response regulator [Erythrobacter sp. SD-21]|uniref:response regulator n=1 Tax=Erythrobacter sp. SD-21 TaxID=161528 RepID=UPI000153FB38|nr:response regulator [Erythrobacter sp. SD-21]EDL49704.1 hypothetical protein ED21_18937 [Erythrobacter sp. SD-21]